MISYTESLGHILTFAFLPYIPAFSRDPSINVSYTPNPDFTPYFTRLNKQIKVFASLNPLKTAFSNKRSGLSANRKNIKGQDWQGYVSTTDLESKFKNCITFTPTVLDQRTFSFYTQVTSFVDSIS